MKELLRNKGNRAAWASLIVVLVGLAATKVLNVVRPEWFCQAVNLGGKELICGAEYSLPIVNAVSWVYLVILGGFYLVAMASLPVGGLKRGGKLILAVLTAFIVAACWYIFEHRHDDSP